MLCLFQVNSKIISNFSVLNGLLSAIQQARIVKFIGLYFRLSGYY